MLVSATITPDLDKVTSLLLHNPATVDVREDAAGGGGGGGALRQFYLRCAHADKFLVMYAPSSSTLTLTLTLISTPSLTRCCCCYPSRCRACGGVMRVLVPRAAGRPGGEAY